MSASELQQLNSEAICLINSLNGAAFLGQESYTADLIKFNLIQINDKQLYCVSMVFG